MFLLHEILFVFLSSFSHSSYGLQSANLEPAEPALVPVPPPYPYQGAYHGILEMHDHEDTPSDENLSEKIPLVLGPLPDLAESLFGDALNSRRSSANGASSSEPITRYRAHSHDGTPTPSHKNRGSLTKTRSRFADDEAPEPIAVDHLPAINYAELRGRPADPMLAQQQMMYEDQQMANWQQQHAGAQLQQYQDQQVLAQMAQQQQMANYQQQQQHLAQQQAQFQAQMEAQYQREMQQGQQVAQQAAQQQMLQQQQQAYNMQQGEELYRQQLAKIGAQDFRVGGGYGGQGVAQPGVPLAVAPIATPAAPAVPAARPAADKRTAACSPLPEKNRLELPGRGEQAGQHQQEKNGRAGGENRYLIPARARSADPNAGRARAEINPKPRGSNNRDVNVHYSPRGDVGGDVRGDVRGGRVSRGQQPQRQQVQFQEPKQEEDNEDAGLLDFFKGAFQDGFNLFRGNNKSPNPNDLPQSKNQQIAKYTKNDQTTNYARQRCKLAANTQKRAHPEYQKQKSILDPSSLDSDDILERMERSKELGQQVFQQPWQTRWAAIKRLGNGAFGETWLVKSKTDSTIAVIKRIPRNQDGAKYGYMSWGDYVQSDENNMLVDAMRDECQWAQHLQKYGQKKGITSRLLFMRCLETNMVKKQKIQGLFGGPTQTQGVNTPQSSHELYVIVSFGGGSLKKLELDTPDQAIIVLGELIGALKYLSLAGVIHHDLKADNIMYSENAGANGAAVGGHIVVIDFGGILPLQCSEDLFIKEKGAFTPGFVGRDYEEWNSYMYDPVYSRATFDTFSMAAVMSELLIGENIVHRFLQQKSPDQYAFDRQQAAYRGTGEIVLPYATNYHGLDEILSSDHVFLEFLRELLRPDVFPDRMHRRDIFEGVLYELGGKFITAWRGMLSAKPKVRQWGFSQMWSIFVARGKGKRGVEKPKLAF